MSNVTVIGPHHFSEDEARAFAREVHSRHSHDEYGWCICCGMASPCRDRQAADELLYGKAAS
jgi:hypothetical protein